eukprot:TRINITY_DN4921_c0_g1_i1.p1 TRINITY_DN4921_c0_g1~~TRINITY_DN4921_c0_g1_i1.p1  ORF type:complete len:244 (+),score=89.26 TRINITY_DN4921_c0_g1_i1:104-733(+)
MRRIFGGSKPTTPVVTLDEATQKMDARVGVTDGKIQKLDTELRDLREKMAKVKPGTSTHNMLKQKALKVLKQRKMYEGQRDQMMNQSFTMEQVNFTSQSMKDTITTVAAMKQASTEMKKQFKQIKIEDIDNMQDELADIFEQHNEIQDSLGRSYDVGEVDESELDDELAALGDELEMDEAPSYLTEESNVKLPDIPVDSSPSAPLTTQQ